MKQYSSTCRSYLEVFSRRPAVLTSFQPGASFRIYGEKSKQLDAGYWQYSDKNQPNQQRRHAPPPLWGVVSVFQHGFQDDNTGVGEKSLGFHGRLRKCIYVLFLLQLVNSCISFFYYSSSQFLCKTFYRHSKKQKKKLPKYTA